MKNKQITRKVTILNLRGLGLTIAAVGYTVLLVYVGWKLRFAADVYREDPISGTTLTIILSLGMGWVVIPVIVVLICIIGVVIWEACTSQIEVPADKDWEEVDNE